MHNSLTLHKNACTDGYITINQNDISVIKSWHYWTVILQENLVWLAVLTHDCCFSNTILFMHSLAHSLNQNIKLERSKERKKYIKETSTFVL